MNNPGGSLPNNPGQYNSQYSHQSSFNGGANMNGYTSQNSFEQRNGIFWFLVL